MVWKPFIPVSDKKTPPEKNTLGSISFQSTESGAGLQFLPIDGMAKAVIKGLRFRRHRYHIASHRVNSHRTHVRVHVHVHGSALDCARVLMFEPVLLS